MTCSSLQNGTRTNARSAGSPTHSSRASSEPLYEARTRRQPSRRGRARKLVLLFQKNMRKPQGTSDLHQLGRWKPTAFIPPATFDIAFNMQTSSSWAALVGAKVGANAQSSSDAGRHPASITPSERHAGRLRTTHADRLGLIWDKSASGSRPAIRPTGSFRRSASDQACSKASR